MIESGSMILTLIILTFALSALVLHPVIPMNTEPSSHGVL